MKNTILKLIKYIFFFLSIGIFFYLSFFILNNKVLHIDSTVYSKIKYLINPKTTLIMKIITSFGYATVVATLILSVFLFPKKRETYLLLSNVIGVLLCNQILKYLITRPRPIENPLVKEFGYSFPSGHSMVALSFYGFFLYLIIKSNIKDFYKVLSFIGITILILLIGVSRIYLGVHYASDVIAGFACATAYLFIFIKLTNKKEQ